MSFVHVDILEQNRYSKTTSVFISKESSFGEKTSFLQIQLNCIHQLATPLHLGGDGKGWGKLRVELERLSPDSHFLWCVKQFLMSNSGIPGAELMRGFMCTQKNAFPRIYYPHFGLCSKSSLNWLSVWKLQNLFRENKTTWCKTQTSLTKVKSDPRHKGKHFL